MREQARELQEIEAIVTRWRTEFEEARRTLRYEDLMCLSTRLDECLAQLPGLVRALQQPAPTVPEPPPLWHASHTDPARDRQLRDMSLQAVSVSRALLATIRIH